MKKQIPVKKGELYTLEIHSLSHNGEGIGRYQGFTVFVPQAVPGDTVEVEIISTKKTYARGLITRIIVSSPNRTPAVCRVSSDCGGCQLQHFNYQAQLNAKQQLVKDALARVGGLQNITVAPVLGMSDPWHYRNKASFPLGGQTGRVKIGFYQPRTHKIIDIDYCHIQHPLINKSLTIIKKLIDNSQIEPYQEINHCGVLRHLIIRIAPGTEEILVALVVNKDIGSPLRQLATAISQEIPEVKGVVLNINEKQTNVIMGNQEITLIGRNYIIDNLLGKSFLISAKSFYQINAVQTPVLYRQAIEKANLQGNEILVDAYCGTGTIGLMLAEQAKQVIGIELIPAAVQDARRNAELNNINNAEFHVGRAEQVIPELISKGLKPDLIVVDPPRKGCDPALLSAIIAAGIFRVVYISCNPATLARDMSILVDNGYQIAGDVQPVDMFGHSSHVECVVRIQRRNCL